MTKNTQQVHKVAVKVVALKAILFFVTFLCVQSLFSQGYKIPETPKFQTSVYDYINLLSSSQKSSLENKLIKYADTTSTQVVVAIINSTEGEEIGYLATNWAHKWGIGGSEKKDNGVFVLLAKNDRKITIRTGYGTEHLLSDYVSRQIIEYDIIPYFKNGDYYGGLDSGTDAIFKVMNGEYKGSRKQTKDGDGGFGFIIFIIILLVFFIIISSGNRGGRGGGRRNYRRSDSVKDLLDVIILSNAGRGGFGGGSFGGGSSGGFGGGGFGGGFGGGGFGGGGATGGW